MYFTFSPITTFFRSEKSHASFAIDVTLNVMPFFVIVAGIFSDVYTGFVSAWTWTVPFFSLTDVILYSSFPEINVVPFLYSFGFSFSVI